MPKNSHLEGVQLSIDCQTEGHHTVIPPSYCIPPPPHINSKYVILKEVGRQGGGGGVTSRKYHRGKWTHQYMLKQKGGQGVWSDGQLPPPQFLMNGLLT